MSINTIPFIKLGICKKLILCLHHSLERRIYGNSYGDCDGTCYVVIIKGKAIQLQAWTGPEGSRRLRLPDFKTIGT